MLKAQLLLAAREPLNADAWRPVIAQAAQVTRAADTRLQAWVLVPGATDGLPHTAALGGDPRSFDAVIDLAAPTLEALQALAGSLPAGLGPLSARSAALAGTEHVVAPGEGAYRFLVVLAPLPTLSREAFHTYWLEHHAAVVRPGGGGGRGYRQFHAEPEASRALGQAVGLTTGGFEGTATGYVPDVASFRAALGDAQRLAPILADERRFIDHTRSAIGLYQELVTVPVA